VRAARHDVRVVIEAPESTEDVAPAGALTVLLHALLDHAIAASPPGSQVVVRLAEEATLLSFTFDDAGPPLPSSARSGVLSREFEVISRGRPTGLALIAAYTIAAHLRMPLDIEEAPQGGTRVRVSLPRSL
jgi:two-component system, OmpR family, sensor kinase